MNACCPRSSGSSSARRPGPYSRASCKPRRTCPDNMQNGQTSPRDRLDNRLLNLMPAFECYLPPASVFDKSVYSAFANAELRRFLRRRGIGSFRGRKPMSASSPRCSRRSIIARDAVCSSSDAGHDALMGLFRRRFDVRSRSRRWTRLSTRGDLCDIGRLHSRERLLSTFSLTAGLLYAPAPSRCR